MNTVYAGSFCICDSVSMLMALCAAIITLQFTYCVIIERWDKDTVLLPSVIYHC